MRHFIFLACLVCCSASAQQRPPVIGASIAADEPSPVKDARRAIMRDSLSRQYTGEEIEQFRRRIDAYDKGQAGVYSEAARVVRRRISVSLNVGVGDAEVPEFRTNAENVGSVVFTDSFGAPWKVADVVVPNFLVATTSNNIVVIRPKGESGQAGGAPARFSRGSITVLLEGLNSTIPFALSFGLSREVDGQVEAKIEARNPLAVVNSVQSGAVESDEFFGLFLDGEPPKDAIKLKTTLKSVSAWSFLGRLYVRTPLSLHSPAFRMFGGSASGMSVYRFDRAPSIINAIVDGAIVAVGIGE